MSYEFKDPKGKSILIDGDQVSAILLYHKGDYKMDIYVRDLFFTISFETIEERNTAYDVLKGTMITSMNCKKC
jgi:hypothetical protein